MKRILSIVLSLSVVLSMTGIFSFADFNTAAGSAFNMEADDVVVIFNSDESEKISGMTLSKAEKYLGMDSDIEIDKVEEIGSYSENDETVNMTMGVLSSDSMSVDEIIEEANESDKVKYAVPNVKVHLMTQTDDTYSDKLWGIDRTNASDVWEQSDEENDYTGTDKVVAVVDTGVDYTHPDLAENMWVNPYQAKLKGKYGYDFVNDDSDPMDDHGHGTHCSGTIGAQGDNGEGVCGMCQNVKIMALKILDANGSGNVEDILSAYSYISSAQDLGIDVVAINNSWGIEMSASEAAMYSEEVSAIENAFEDVMNTVGAKGALSICAAGNSGASIDNIVAIPAGCDSDYIVSVAALNKDGSQAYYSNYSKKSVDIAAPGTDVLSTVCYKGLDLNLLSEEQKQIAINHVEGYEDDVDLSGVLYFDSENKKGIALTEDADYSCCVTEEKKASGNKSLKFEVVDAQAGESYAFAIPMDLCGQKNPYVQFKTYSTSGSLNELSYIDFVEVNGRLSLTTIKNSYAIDDTYAQGRSTKWNNMRGSLIGDGSEASYFVVLFSPLSDGTFELCLDDFIMTNTPTDEINNMKSKYDTYSGTSMATPHVTGAVALVENYISKSLGVELDKEDRALAIKDIILNSAAETNAKVKYGELDLENIKTSPVISKLEVSSDALTITGKNFIPGTKVTVNGVEYSEPEISEDGRVLTIPADYRNYKLYVTVENDFGKATKEKMLFSGKTDYVNQNVDLEDIGDIPEDGELFSSGTQLYMMYTGYNTIEIARYKDGKFENAGSIESVTGIEDMSYTLASKPVVCDGKVYVLAAGTEEEAYAGTGDYLFDINKTYECEYRLISISLSEIGKGKCEAYELPSSYENIDGEALAAYNGNIYLLGGYDYAKEDLSTLVYKYSPSSGKWTKPSNAQLPEERYGGCAVQSGNTLYYAMGAAKSGLMPKVLKFNGTSWTMSDVQLDSEDYAKSKVGNLTLNSYNGNICLVSGGVVLTGVLVNGYGDTIKYVSDKYTASKYNYKKENGSEVTATALGKYIYILSEDGLYRGTFTSGLVKATGSFSHGKVINSGKYYLPGTKVKFTAKANKGYKKKTFYVNGKKVSGTVKTVRLTGNIKIKATFKKKK